MAYTGTSRLEKQKSQRCYAPTGPRTTVGLYCNRPETCRLPYRRWLHDQPHSRAGPVQGGDDMLHELLIVNSLIRYSSPASQGSGYNAPGRLGLRALTACLSAQRGGFVLVASSAAPL